MVSLLKKKDKNKNKDADSSVSDVSLPITAVTNSSNHVKKADEHRNDTIKTALSETAVVLDPVSEAAQFAPFPELQHAASLALGIATIVQRVKESNHQYELLASDATDYIAVIWRSYQQSMHQDNWLSPDLRVFIAELVVVLEEITEFVKEKTKRWKLMKMFFSNADHARVQHYKERMKSAVTKFEVNSDLKSEEMIQQVLRDQLQLAQHLQSLGVGTLSPAILLLGESSSGFDTGTSSNSSTSLVSPLVASSHPESTATSPRANDQPLIEESTQPPRIVSTHGETLHTASGTASNSPQPSSPPLAPSTFASTSIPASRPPPPSSSPSRSTSSSLASSSSFSKISINNTNDNRNDNHHEHDHHGIKISIDATGRQRGSEAYDDRSEEEEPRRVSGTGRASQRNRSATVQEASDEDEEYGPEEYGPEEYGTPRKAAAVVSGCTASATAAGTSARKAAANRAVGKDESLSIKSSKIDIRRKPQPEEEEEDEEEEEGHIPLPPMKRRPKQPQQEDPYNQYGNDQSYRPGCGPYHDYHPSPPPQPMHLSYYGQPPPPRYGPGALGGFMLGLGYGMGGGTSSSVMMTNVGNDNSVHVVTNKTK